MKQFILEHREEDVRQLALQASRYPEIDMPYALTQIAGWQSLRDKVPSWAEHQEIIYPQHLSLEQCSSEQTALYKQQIVKETGKKTNAFTDLTGGFGIDCSFIGKLFKKATYVERQESLCQIASHNFQELGLNHISVCNDDANTYLQQASPCDWIFIDPARRNDHGGKTVAISDCEPDVGELEALLVAKATKVMVKLSPMLDLSLALQQLKHVEEVHIISVNNECKELLLLLSNDCLTDIERTPIHCVNIQKEMTQHLLFTRGEEHRLSDHYAHEIGKYLYEPNASLMKAGAFKCLAFHYQVEQLQANSHLYTSENLVRDFPGRIFEVEASSKFGKKDLKALLTGITKANLSVRNFPSSVSELRKRLHIAEGGDTYLFATTFHPQEKVLIRCKKQI